MEVKGYVCDGGCGATATLTQSGQTLQFAGWYQCFRPRGGGLQTCSATCMTKALEAERNFETRQLTEVQRT